jgi:hypothetical protein
MLSIFHYWSAKERLAEHEKTIMMLGGESECQPMILAQRDMVELEMKYYKEEMRDLIFQTGMFFAFTMIVLSTYYIFFIKY